MTTIHLTDAQHGTFAACGLIVIDGEPPPVIRTLDGYPSAIQWNSAPVAPEGWRILTESCDTCDGTGRKDLHRVPHAGFGYMDYFNPCPDCVGGRRVVTLTAPCHHLRPAFCVDTYCPGKVTLGRFVLTMRALDDGRFEITPERVQ